jgi:hypothetical protein
MAIVRLEGLGKSKNPMTSWGIKPAFFWLIAQCLNQLHYRVPQFKMQANVKVNGKFVLALMYHAMVT